MDNPFVPVPAIAKEDLLTTPLPQYRVVISTPIRCSSDISMIRTPPTSRFGRRADQAVVAPAADGGGGAGLEVLAEDALAYLEDGALDSLGVVGLGRRRHLVAVE